MEAGLYQNIVQAAAEGICVMDVESFSIEYVNPAIYQILARDVLSPIEIVEYLGCDAQLQAKNASDLYSYETSWEDSSGQIRHAKVSVSHYQDEATGSRKCILVVTDITDLKNLQEHFEWVSMRDELTGLHNRRFFLEEVKRLDSERLLPLSIIIADLNGLKIINDCLGHEQGDRLLRKASDTIRDQFRSHDIVTRIGGDEFAVILPSTGEQTALEICKRIEQACEQVTLNNERIPLSISVGSATRMDMETDIFDVVRAADDAMYRVKLTQREASRENLIAAFIRGLSRRDYMTPEKIRQLEEMIDEQAVLFKLEESQIADLGMLALIHDIGHIGVAEEVLFKEGPLSEIEREMLKRHSEIGYRIVQESNSLTHLSELVLYHHEWWNGKGYPQGLMHEDIPYLDRLWAVLDAFDAMTTDRPYQKTISVGEACKELERMSGIQFDPDIVKRFLTGQGGKGSFAS